MNSKKCKSCGVDVPADAKFCPECAAPLTPGARQSSKTAISKKRSNPRRDNLIIIGVIVVVAVGYLIMNRPAPSETPPPPAANAQNPHGGDMDAMMGALANMPSDYASLVQMGNESMDHGNYAFRKVLSDDPAHTIANYNLGVVFFSIEQSDSAKVYFTKYLKLDPQGQSPFR
jgi:predicted nucleic acid-binding Zn ribbon protein